MGKFVGITIAGSFGMAIRDLSFPAGTELQFGADQLAENTRHKRRSQALGKRGLRGRRISTQEIDDAGEVASSFAELFIQRV